MAGASWLEIGEARNVYCTATRVSSLVIEKPHDGALFLPIFTLGRSRHPETPTTGSARLMRLHCPSIDWKFVCTRVVQGSKLRSALRRLNSLLDLQSDTNAAVHQSGLKD